MLLCAMFQFFDGMAITFNSALRGAGDTLWPAILLVTSSLLFLVAGGWLLARLLPAWGSMGPWLAATIHIIVAGSAVALRYRFGSWERIELIREGACARPDEPAVAQSR
jgi:Na+-driven multidrug efflux pump